jgi:hypothetical protein
MKQIEALEKSFRELTLALYDTEVAPERVDALVTPHLHERVRFTDPWQSAEGKEKYRVGAAGFHQMLRFDFEIKQLHVELNEAHTRGRALVDGVMHLKQLSWLYTYPLRTMLVYEFTVEPPPVRFLIHHHEEMWSLADMIDAVPGVGWVYRTLFRPAFSVGFLAASVLSGGRKRLTEVQPPLGSK